MTVKELKAYLDKFPDGEEVRFLAADIKNRIAWPNYQIGTKCIDYSTPVICLELHECESFDEELIQAAEEYERNSMWIPVTERLPEKLNKYYLVTLGNSRREVITIEYGVLGGTSKWFNPYIPFEQENVIAWMPLPEPYKEEKGLCR